MAVRLTRRQFLALPLPLLVTSRRAWGAPALAARERRYEARIGVLFDLLSFSVSGRITEEVDRTRRRYRVTVEGGGVGVTGRTESAGLIQDGRFMPLETTSVTTVRGRENRTQVSYDLERRIVRFRSVSYTLLLGRRREVDDTVAVPAGIHVDDLVSAELNFAENTLDREPDGSYRVTVARRAWTEDEGADDVAAGGYRAELRTVQFRPTSQPETGRLHALVDLTGFSSWARSGRPARVAFGPDRHLESVESSLILATTFTLRLAPTA